MDFNIFIIKLSFVFCLIGAPIMILMVKKDAPKWQRTLKLLLPIFVFFVTVFFITARQCPIEQFYECFVTKTLLIIYVLFLYVMFLGWFEYIWRRRHKRIVWPIKENLHYDVISNVFIVISIFMTIIVFVLLGLQLIINV